MIVNDRPYHSPDIDYQTARSMLWCFPGKAIFAAPTPQDENQRESGLLLTDRGASIRRLPVATCIAAHPDTDILPGQIYIVHQAYAKRVRQLRFGDWCVPRGEAEIWLFGCTSPTVQSCQEVPASKYALSQLQREYLCAETLDEYKALIYEFVQPRAFPFRLRDIPKENKAVGIRYVTKKGRAETSGTVVLRLPERKLVSSGGIELANRQKERPDVAVIESVSSECKTAQAGMVVWYERRALTGLYEGPDGFGVLPEMAIYAAVDL